MAIKLNELVNAFSAAVIDAQRIATETQYRALMQYFNDDGSPKTRVLKIPKPTTGEHISKEREYHLIEVPIITLTPPTSLSIKDLTVSMNVDISEMPAGIKTKPAKNINNAVQTEVLVHASTASTKQAGDVGVAQITLRVSTTDGNEAMTKLLSHLQKVF